MCSRPGSGPVIDGRPDFNILIVDASWFEALRKFLKDRMQSTKFTVVPPRTTASISGPGFVLEQDNWNDYSFETQYILSYFAPTANDLLAQTHIGAVKILRRGQTKRDQLLIVANFEELDETFCSVGTGLDYYARLRDLGNIGAQAMNALRDVIAMPQLVPLFAHEPGWVTSLFRDQKDQGESFRTLAIGMLSGQYAKAPKDQQSFTFKMADWESVVEVCTLSGEPYTFGPRSLPERINVLVGRNGSGKSTLLARLARVAFGSHGERGNAPLVDLGILEPDGIGFPRIVTVAFSPFDCFKLPGSDDRNRIQIAKDMKNGLGRFVFIGLRDFAAEAEPLGSAPAPPTIRKFSYLDDRVTQTRLKSIEKLGEEFLAYREKIVMKKRDSILLTALSQLEKGLFSEHWAQSSMQLSENDVLQWFRNCSTGHKITLLVIFGLVANLEPYSLVLFDEPETHLHPPLLSAMMHALRTVLEKYEASALVATHSPVVVQESMARHVHVVRRESSVTTVDPVSIETFGESIGIITAQVFGMESNATDFHDVLDDLVKKFKDVAKIESLFKDGMMSQQARAYVMGRVPGNSGK